jgi:hypothetical protein
MLVGLTEDDWRQVLKLSEADGDCRNLEAVVASGQPRGTDHPARRLMAR